MAELTISADEIRSAIENYVSSYSPDASREEVGVVLQEEAVVEGEARAGEDLVAEVGEPRGGGGHGVRSRRKACGAGVLLLKEGTVISAGRITRTARSSMWSARSASGSRTK